MDQRRRRTCHRRVDLGLGALRRVRRELLQLQQDLRDAGGGVIVFLLWLWITNVALLFGGAELDAELERGGRQLQAGLHAERDLQLPPRDTKKMVEKNEAKEQALIEEGRKLRRSRGGRSD